MVESSKTSRAYDTLIGVRNKITRLNGIITPESVDKLEDELGSVCTIIKTHHYTEGQKYGHLASVIPQDKYRIVISNATWVHAAPVDPGAYSAAALGVGNAAAQRKQLIAEHKQLQTSYASYLGVEEAGKELILYAVGNDACPPQKAIHRLWGLNDPHDVGPSPPEDSHQDDHSAKAGVQDQRLQLPLGPDHKHHRLFY
jgi:hypothetical protein